MHFSAPPYDHDHENEVTLFAETNYRGLRRPFGIKTDDRRRHVYVIGKTGMGKTTLLENMVLADIYAGHGLAYIDPHGDTAQKLLDFIPPHRINDVVYFNPGDMDNPIGFNIFETVDPDKKHLVAAGLMAVFKKMWPDVWSARMEYILLNTILALLDAPGSTLLGINRLLVDEEYRKRVVSLIQDPVVKTFWVKEFAAFSEKYRTEAIAPVQNKVGQFLSASIIRNIVAQVKSTIDMRQIMDERKIFILNLSKGLIGEENARLLGGMIVTRLQLSAMERVDMPEADRQDFYLYIDEFQNFATESFANILSEARKYRLCLTVAHQYIEQLDETVRDAIFGNVGTILMFRVGGPDSVVLENEFMPQFEANDLVNLGKYDIYLKLMIDGAASQPFSATTLPPIAQRTDSAEKVIKVSRERYTRPRASIEDKVIRWSGMGTSDEGTMLEVSDESGPSINEKLKALEASSPQIAALPPGAGSDKPKKPAWEIPCSVCGKVQKLTFEPDWSRPWFCKEDLEKRQQEQAAGIAPRPLAPPSGGFGGNSIQAPRPMKVVTSFAPAPKPAATRPAAPVARAEKPQPTAAEIRSAPSVIKAGADEEAISLSSLLGKAIPTGDEPEVIIEDDGPEDDMETDVSEGAEAVLPVVAGKSARSERPAPSPAAVIKTSGPGLQPVKGAREKAPPQPAREGQRPHGRGEHVGRSGKPPRDRGGREQRPAPNAPPAHFRQVTPPPARPAPPRSPVEPMAPKTTLPPGTPEPRNPGTPDKNQPPRQGTLQPGDIIKF